MNTENENNENINPLHEKIFRKNFPLAFSTEIKSRKNFNKKIDNEYSFKAGNDNTIFREGSNDENENEISLRYLEKHEKPDFNIQHTEIERKMLLHESKINQPNDNDISYFRHLSNSIDDSQSCIFIKPMYKQLSIDTSLFTNRNNSTVTIYKEIEEKRKEFNSNVSGLDKRLGEVDLSNVTQLANDFKKSDSKKELSRKEELLLSDKNKNDVSISSNSSHILWIGVSVNKKEINSFPLKLRSSLPQKVHISLKGNSDSFFLTNQQGNNESRFIDEIFEPQTIKKFYITFYPTNSNYHQDTIIISVGERRFKISLFGYAGPSIVDLKGFNEFEDPNNSEKKLLVKNFTKFKGVNTFTISIFNSGERTAFVSLKKCNEASKVTFQPKMFLLIPKTKMDIDVNIKGDESSMNFFMFSVDEELRRAARKQFRELPNNNEFTTFYRIGIFTNLPEEKSIRQDDLPKFNWIPHLCIRTNESLRKCCLNFNDNIYDSSSIDQPPSESIKSIDIMSRSWSTSFSAVNKHLAYLNIRESFANSLCVDILSDFSAFSQTCIKMSNYLGILIRNNNQFAVNWVVTGMTNITDKSNSSNVYYSNRIPIYDHASCMSILCKEGSLESDETFIIPVRFTPENTGKTECRCTVKICSRNDEDIRLERDLEFVAGAVRKDEFNFVHPKIPCLKIVKYFQDSFYLSEYKNTKYQLKLRMKNESNHNLQIFASRLKEPFHITITTINLMTKNSQLFINFRATRRGIFNEVLVLSDSYGNSTFVTLVVEVK